MTLISRIIATIIRYVIETVRRIALAVRAHAVALPHRAFEGLKKRFPIVRKLSAYYVSKVDTTIKTELDPDQRWAPTALNGPPMPLKINTSPYFKWKQTLVKSVAFGAIKFRKEASRGRRLGEFESIGAFVSGLWSWAFSRLSVEKRRRPAAAAEKDERPRRRRIAPVPDSFLVVSEEREAPIQFPAAVSPLQGPVWIPVVVQVIIMHLLEHAGDHVDLFARPVDRKRNHALSVYFTAKFLSDARRRGGRRAGRTPGRIDVQFLRQNKITVFDVANFLTTVLQEHHGGLLGSTSTYFILAEAVAKLDALVSLPPDRRAVAHKRALDRLAVELAAIPNPQRNVVYALLTFLRMHCSALERQNQKPVRSSAASVARSFDRLSLYGRRKADLDAEQATKVTRDVAVLFAPVLLGDSVDALVESWRQATWRPAQSRPPSPEHDPTPDPDPEQLPPTRVSPALRTVRSLRSLHLHSPTSSLRMRASKRRLSVPFKSTTTPETVQLTDTKLLAADAERRRRRAAVYNDCAHVLERILDLWEPIAAQIKD
ncbi:uncharacterized protein V1510DRAFT_400526 [Dipodascopsis tothii]|uniref:uncharacterized protein n=1 Tax=Dipodascopsis tothii TaxID=44089 RepID=UPI0034CE8228